MVAKFEIVKFGTVESRFRGEASLVSTANPFLFLRAVLGCQTLLASLSPRKWFLFEAHNVLSCLLPLLSFHGMCIRNCGASVRRF